MGYGNKKFCPHLNATGVRASLIGTGAVETKHLAAVGVSKAKIAPLAVTNSKVGTNAIDGRVIAADAVNTSHLNTNAVNGVVLAQVAVSGGHVITNTIAKLNIAPLAVTNSKVATQTLTLGGATHGVALGKLNALVFSVAFGSHLVTVGVTHGLGQAAEGWWVIRNNKSGWVYEAANVATQLRLVCDGEDVTNAAVKVAVF